LGSQRHRGKLRQDDKGIYHILSADVFSKFFDLIIFIFQIMVHYNNVKCHQKIFPQYTHHHSEEESKAISIQGLCNVYERKTEKDMSNLDSEQRDGDD